MKAAAPAATRAESLRGQVMHLFYSSPQFCAGKLKTHDGRKVMFAGQFCVREGDPVIFHGRWGMHEKYGRQFQVEWFEYDAAPSIEGLANYLAAHPSLMGIGPVKAWRIAEQFAEGFDQALAERPEEIALAAGVPLATIKALAAEWRRVEEVRSALTLLSAYGLTHHQVTLLVEKHGNSIVALLQEDPYRLVGEIQGMGFKRVDKIARKLGTPKDHASRIRAGIMDCVHEALDSGHCWVEYEDLVSLANQLLVMDTLDSRESIEQGLDELIEEGKLACVPHGGRFAVALPSIHRMEQDLAERFSRAKESSPHFGRVTDLESLLARCTPSLNQRQREAVESALHHSISLISGGAGSGKSYTVSAITAVCEELDLEVTLAAPTGKAAKRLEEVSGRSAKTIHRLLGYDGKSFSRDGDHPLETDVLVIDEVSMVDVSLAWRLFDALDLSRTAVVLVGDHNQLPPVGPGNILRDLIQTKAIPMVILDKVVRQAGLLKENSTAVLRGEVCPTSPARPDGCRDWYLVDQFTEPLAARQFLLELFERRIDELGFDPLRDVQVLTPTHKGPLGTVELNEHLQRLLQRKLWGVEVEPVPAGRRPPFYLRDKVIQTRNNYDLGVMNGAIGSVIEIKPDGAHVIDFDGVPIEIEKGSNNLRDLQLSYALTIHKCVSGETLISTRGGLVKMDELAAGIETGHVKHCLIPLSTHRGKAMAVSICAEGEQDCIRLETERGFTITVSSEHKLYVATANGLQWMSADCLAAGDTVVLRRGTMNEHGDIPLLEVFHDGQALVINENVAWLLGVLLGDGNQTDTTDYRIEVTKGAHDLLLRYIALIQSCLGVRTTIRPVKNGAQYSAYFHDKQARMLLREAGLGFERAASKTTPWSILKSPATVQRAYLRGLFDTDGGVNGAGVHFTTTSRGLAAEVQQLLLANGVIASNHLMRPPDRDKGWNEVWRVTVSGAREIQRFADLAGFAGEMKEFALATACHCGPQDGYKSNVGIIPFGKKLIFEFRDELRRRGGRNYPEAPVIGALLSRVINGVSQLSHHHVEWLAHQVSQMQASGPAGEKLHELFSQQYVFERIARISKVREHVYDFLVPGDHSYIGNGFVNHNCQGSEFPCALVVVHKSHSFMHHRNLLYTGVTRARRTAIIIGDRWGIRNCATRCQVDERRTFLSLMLREGRTQAALQDLESPVGE